MATTGTIREAVVRVSVEDLSGHLATLETELSEGRSIEVVRGETVIAEVRAPRAVGKSMSAGTRELPDFMGRMRAIWGDKPVDVDMTAVIREDRDARG